MFLIGLWNVSTFAICGLGGFYALKQISLLFVIFPLFLLFCITVLIPYTSYKYSFIDPQIDEWSYFFHRITMFFYVMAQYYILYVFRIPIMLYEHHAKRWPEYGFITNYAQAPLYTTIRNACNDYLHNQTSCYTDVILEFIDRGIKNSNSGSSYSIYMHRNLTNYFYIYYDDASKNLILSPTTDGPMREAIMGRAEVSVQSGRQMALPMQSQSVNFIKRIEVSGFKAIRLKNIRIQKLKDQPDPTWQSVSPMTVLY